MSARKCKILCEEKWEGIRRIPPTKNDHIFPGTPEHIAQARPCCCWTSECICMNQWLQALAPLPLSLFLASSSRLREQEVAGPVPLKVRLVTAEACPVLPSELP